jgi:Family of unknown function (DUF6444)/Transposase IS66 family
MSAEERIAELEATIAQLREQVAQQEVYIRDLEARVAKDSHNSSKPPSSDGLKRKTKCLRHKSGKKPGGQLGHRGETVHLLAIPDEVVEHRPAVCPQCQTPLGEAEVVLRERRQVQELPPRVRRVGMLAWAHVTSTSRLTHYAIHPTRGHEALDAIGILPAYHGVSVHDGWDSYALYTTCRQALCNVHHLRELTFLEEVYH